MLLKNIKNKPLKLFERRVTGAALPKGTLFNNLIKQSVWTLIVDVISKKSKGNFLLAEITPEDESRSESSKGPFL